MHESPMNEAFQQTQKKVREFCLSKDERLGIEILKDAQKNCFSFAIRKTSEPDPEFSELLELARAAGAASAAADLEFGNEVVGSIEASKYFVPLRDIVYEFYNDIDDFNFQDKLPLEFPDRQGLVDGGWKNSNGTLEFQSLQSVQELFDIATQLDFTFELIAPFLSLLYQLDFEKVSYLKIQKYMAAHPNTVIQFLSGHMDELIDEISLLRFPSNPFLWEGVCIDINSEKIIVDYFGRYEIEEIDVLEYFENCTEIEPNLVEIGDLEIDTRHSSRHPNSEEICTRIIDNNYLELLNCIRREFDDTTLINFPRALVMLSLRLYDSVIDDRTIDLNSYQLIPYDELDECSLLLGPALLLCSFHLFFIEDEKQYVPIILQIPDPFSVRIFGYHVRLPNAWRENENDVIFVSNRRTCGNIVEICAFLVTFSETLGKDFVSAAITIALENALLFNYFENDDWVICLQFIQLNGLHKVWPLSEYLNEVFFPLAAKDAKGTPSKTPVSGQIVRIHSVIANEIPAGPTFAFSNETPINLHVSDQNPLKAEIELTYTLFSNLNNDEINDDQTFASGSIFNLAKLYEWELHEAARLFKVIPFSASEKLETIEEGFQNYFFLHASEKAKNFTPIKTKFTLARKARNEIAHLKDLCSAYTVGEARQHMRLLLDGINSIAELKKIINVYG
jgi:hypothetical protein